MPPTRVQLRRSGAASAGWETFPNAAAAAHAKALDGATLSKVLHRKRKTTGGFEARYENGEDGPRGRWGRRLHRTIHGVTGKVCCTCGVWRPLDAFTTEHKHWDGKRRNCADCVRDGKRKRRKTEGRASPAAADPSDVQPKRMRALLSDICKSIRAFHGNVNAPTHPRLREVLSCSCSVFCAQIEAQLDEAGLPYGWEEYGKTWHIALRVPCSAFDLDEAEMARACFHHTNLFPRANGQGGRRPRLSDAERQDLVRQACARAATAG